MRQLALDPTTGDLLVESGKTRLTAADAPETFGQRLQIRLALWQGEYGPDINQGIPYADLLGVKGASDRLQRTLRKAALTSPGVASLVSFPFVLGSDRVARVNGLQAKSITGEPITLDAFVAGAT